MRRAKKYLKIAVPVLFVAGVIVCVVLWARAPQEGRITKSAVTKGPTTYYDKKLEGTYISFQYSGKYIVRNETAKDNDVELYTLSANTRYDKRILVSVANLPDGRLESNGAYIFRKKSPTVYTIRTVQVGDTQVEVWVKSDGLEQTAMIPRGNKVAVISFVTANMSDDLTTEADALLKTFRWVQ